MCPVYFVRGASVPAGYVGCEYCVQISCMYDGFTGMVFFFVLFLFLQQFLKCRAGSRRAFFFFTVDLTNGGERFFFLFVTVLADY